MNDYAVPFHLVAAVTTGGMNEYNALDPGYQRVTVKSAGFPSQGLGNFNFATGCGSTNQPDLVTQLCFRQSNMASFMDAFRITFQSGYYVSCVNHDLGDGKILWSDSLAGYCVPNSATFELGDCISINSASSERIVAARFGDYSAHGSFSRGQLVAPNGDFEERGSTTGNYFYDFGRNVVAVVEVKTNVGQDFLSPPPASGNLPGRAPMEILATAVYTDYYNRARG